MNQASLPSGAPDRGPWDDDASRPAAPEVAVRIPPGRRLRPIVAPAIVAVNVVVFLLMVVSGVSPLAPQPEQLLDWGATFGGFVLAGDWWRLITSMFVHIGIIHLAFNMQALWRIGGLAERLFGRWPFLAFYVLSGIGGAVASLWSNPDVVAAGASAAIFGIAGGLVVLLWRGRLPLPRGAIQATLTSMLLFVAYNLFYGFVNSRIDNAGHLGGLATGALIGVLLAGPLASPERRGLVRRLLLATFLLLALVVGTYLVQGGDPTKELARAESLLLDGQADEAIAAIEQVLEEDADLAVAHFLLGNAYLQKDLFTEAIAAYSQAIMLGDDYFEAYFNRGLAYTGTGQLNEALADFNSAIDLVDDDADAYFLRGLVYADLGQTDKAMADLQAALSLGLGPEAEEYAESILQQLR